MLADTLLNSKRLLCHPCRQANLSMHLRKQLSEAFAAWTENRHFDRAVCSRLSQLIDHNRGFKKEWVTIQGLELYHQFKRPFDRLPSCCPDQESHLELLLGAPETGASSLTNLW